MSRFSATFASALAMLAMLPGQAAPSNPAIRWEAWSTGVFERARHEQRFVILDLQAVWCHWCHVMEATTYHDPKVVGLIGAKYIAVRADEDADPYLANRYGDWGWPATIVFAPAGEEIVKRRGYIPPADMAALLQAVIDDPTPGPSVQPSHQVVPASSALLTPAQRKLLIDRRAQIYDRQYGGWGEVHKFIAAEDMEYAISQALAGDQNEAASAKQTLDAALNLLDPVWGGFFQYSDSRNWKSPHFEKIIAIQSDYIRIYSLAWAAFRKPEYLNAARRTAEYLSRVLKSPDGAFYVSQDADVSEAALGRAFYKLDDAGRRRMGAPRVDTHLYARENGWAIRGLAALYDVSGEPSYIDQARAAAQWVVSNRSLARGGFAHGAQDRGGPFLGDSLAMAQAFVALYESTAERAWLKRAEQTVEFIDANFADTNAGYLTAIGRNAPAASGVEPVSARSYRDADENIALARLANLLSHFTGNARYRKIAERAMRYAASPQTIEDRFFLTGLLLADHELAGDPLHVTVVGAKHDPDAARLYRAALDIPAIYARIEWWDKREGAMPNADVTYPAMAKAAAFVCSGNTCSLPVFDPGKLARTIDRASARSVGRSGPASHADPGPSRLKRF